MNTPALLPLPFSYFRKAFAQFTELVQPNKSANLLKVISLGHPGSVAILGTPFGEVLLKVVANGCS